MHETPPAADWDRYWKGTWEAAAHQDGSPQEQALEQFWDGVFNESDTPAGQLLDVAAGNGAVLRYASRHLPGTTALWALDYSPSALLNLKQRMPAVVCVAADGKAPPFVDQCFDLVASQFGVEYAGLDAVTAVAELVQPGGRLALVLHQRHGAIYEECQRNQNTLTEVRELRLLPLARQVFQAGFDFNAKRAPIEVFKQAEAEFTPAVRGLEQILRREGKAIAGGLLQQLYTDIAAIYRRMSAYDSAEIIGWVDGLIVELEAYIGRMASMTGAALSEREFLDLIESLGAAGFIGLQSGRLLIGAEAREAGWTLLAQRA